MKTRKLSYVFLLVSTLLLVGCGKKETAPETSQTVTTEENNTAGNTVENTQETTEEAESTVTYPITIQHAFGETVIESEPQNIATIAWGNQDVPLALGVVPVGVSKANFGTVDENGLLPWTAAAYKELGVESPAIFDDIDGLDYEAISNANPDVILASYSGLTQEEYDLLSQIAPVIAYPKAAWQTYWREQTMMNAIAMGKEEEGKALVAETEQLIEEKTGAVEALKDKTGAFFYFNPSDLGTFYIYLPADPRAAYLVDLGLEFPESVMNLATDPSAFTVTLSAENLDILTDIDVIVTYGDASVLEALQADSLVGQIPAVANGAVVLVGNDGTLAASCTPSVLSIPETIDEYVGLLSEAASKVK